MRLNVSSMPVGDSGWLNVFDWRYSAAQLYSCFLFAWNHEICETTTGSGQYLMGSIVYPMCLRFTCHTLCVELDLTRLASRCLKHYYRGHRRVRFGIRTRKDGKVFLAMLWWSHCKVASLHTFWLSRPLGFWVPGRDLVQTCRSVAILDGCEWLQVAAETFGW